jgi:hypothetical protein
VSRRALFGARVTRRGAGAALCSSLLLQLLRGTNPKQRAMPRALSPCFQADVSREVIPCISCLHKDSLRRSIAGGDERDSISLPKKASRDADVSRA